ncbi:hypothetical protein F4780DRAFT_357186 [Xylariomycetidae sp. FL0641]|nr:hypothetical protein F4780DRAFT_357186 [Xylariomycetidae sp. FL0641]
MANNENYEGLMAKYEEFWSPAPEALDLLELEKAYNRADSRFGREAREAAREPGRVHLGSPAEYRKRCREDGTTLLETMAEALCGAHENFRVKREDLGGLAIHLEGYYGLTLDVAACLAVWDQQKGPKEKFYHRNDEVVTFLRK